MNEDWVCSQAELCGVLTVGRHECHLEDDQRGLELQSIQHCSHAELTVGPACSTIPVSNESPGRSAQCYGIICAGEYAQLIRCTPGSSCMASEAEQVGVRHAGQKQTEIRCHAKPHMRLPG